jgi:hypothetical protein
MMPADIQPSQADPPPTWALDQATDELYDVDDRSTIVERARQIVREVQQLHDEQHTEYDDPDQGGEG